jgi:hypothetical protein
MIESTDPFDVETGGVEDVPDPVQPDDVTEPDPEPTQQIMIRRVDGPLEILARHIQGWLEDMSLPGLLLTVLGATAGLCVMVWSAAHSL